MSKPYDSTKNPYSEEFEGDPLEFFILLKRKLMRSLQDYSGRPLIGREMGERSAIEQQIALASEEIEKQRAIKREAESGNNGADPTAMAMLSLGIEKQTTEPGGDGNGIPIREGISCDVFKTNDDWLDRTKVDEYCRRMTASNIPFPPKKGAPCGSDLSEWNDLIGKRTTHPEYERLFGGPKGRNLKNSTLFIKWRKARKSLKKTKTR